MQPLTIEQLKTLKVGDWVWVTPRKEYGMISICDKFLLLYVLGGTATKLNYDDYGTKWLAYKNKEQAEAEGEIVELPCKRKAKSTLPKYEVVFIDKYGRTVVERFVDEPQADRRLAELKGVGRCKTCKWHKHENIDDGYVCCNGDSPNVAEWTEDDDRCTLWEGKE